MHRSSLRHLFRIHLRALWGTIEGMGVIFGSERLVEQRLGVFSYSNRIVRRHWDYFIYFICNSILFFFSLFYSHRTIVMLMLSCCCWKGMNFCVRACLFFFFLLFFLPIIIDCSFYPRAKAPSSTGIAGLA